MNNVTEIEKFIKQHKYSDMWRRIYLSYNKRFGSWVVKYSGATVVCHSLKHAKKVVEQVGRNKNNQRIHAGRKMTDSLHLRNPEAEDFGDRLQKIRSSLERINKLMAELKKE